jgi:hypothetical protein
MNLKLDITSCEEDRKRGLADAYWLSTIPETIIANGFSRDAPNARSSDQYNPHLIYIFFEVE